MTVSAEPGTRAVFIRNQWLLSAAQLFSGVGIAVGFAVGGLLAEQLTGRAEYAGFAQTASIVGAGVLAIPLARLAEWRSRRYALSLGFSLAALGALIILTGARIDSPAVFFVGMALFGSATASGLQSRYAAADSAPQHLKGRALSIVVWATTVGSVAGPNLADPGAAVGRFLGVSGLGGPFAISVVAYLVAVGFTSRLGRARPSLLAPIADPPLTAPPVVGGPAATNAATPAATNAATAAATKAATPASTNAATSASTNAATPAATNAATAAATPSDTGPVASAGETSSVVNKARPTIREALRAIASRPRALLGFAAVVLGHTVMVSVMVMTPVHMAHAGDTIAVIGIVISLHIMGMYALSPIFGWAADRFGPVPVIWVGFALFTVSALVGIADDVAGSSMPRISVALIALGLGWSACFIAGSTLISESVPGELRVTVQGATDAAMNLGAAIFAAAAGPLLTAGGFTLINIVALGIVAVGVAIAVSAAARHRATTA